MQGGHPVRLKPGRQRLDRFARANHHIFLILIFIFYLESGEWNARARRCKTFAIGMHIVCICICISSILSICLSIAGMAI